MLFNIGSDGIKRLYTQTCKYEINYKLKPEDFKLFISADDKNSLDDKIPVPFSLI